MKMKIALILSIVTISTTCADENIDSLVNKYVEWYKERSRESSEYVFPTDARCYEVDNMVPEGR